MSYPWEAAQTSYPWAGATFPRTITVHRSSTVAGSNDAIGNVGYSGRDESTNAGDPEGEQVLFTGIPANIEAVAIGRTRGGIVPADAAEKPQWRILIPGISLAKYSVRDRDIIIDDEGYRYIVVQNWFTMLGYQINVIRLEA